MFRSVPHLTSSIPTYENVQAAQDGMLADRQSVFTYDASITATSLVNGTELIFANTDLR